MGVKDIDMGWGRIQHELMLLDGGFTKVGVQTGEKRIDEGKTSEMAEIAAANELGTKKIPSRPAMRNAFDKNLVAINNFRTELHNKILENKLRAKRALDLLGEFHTSNVKREYTDLKDPPNAPATILKKKSSNPLIDTAQLRNSMSHVENI